MRQNAAKWWIPLLRGPVLLFGFLIGPLYKILFGWADKRSARKREERLATDVRLTLRSFFNEGRARIIPNQGVPFPPGFDLAFVTVEFDKLLLRYIRGCGELGAHVAPKHDVSDWHDLSLVLGLIDGEPEPRRRTFRDVWEVARSLESRIEALSESLSPEHFNDLKQRLETDVYRWERIAIKEAEFEINSRLYGNRRD